MLSREGAVVSTIFPGRFTAKFDGSLVVFIIGIDHVPVSGRLESARQPVGNAE